MTARAPATEEGVAGGSFRLCLLVQHPDGKIDRNEARGAALVVGSDPECNVHLDLPGVAPFHAFVQVSGGLLYVTDRSATGTKVGGRFVRQETVPFEVTDVLEIMDRRIRTQLLAEPSPAASFDDKTDATEKKEGAPSQEAKPVTASEGPSGEADRKAARKHDVAVSVRRRIHRELIDNLDLARLERSKMNDHLLRAKVALALGKIVERFRHEMPAATDTGKLIDELTHEAIGLGPLEPLLADPKVTEIMVVDPMTIYIERERRVVLTDAHFTDEESTRAVLERIVAPLGRRIDESAPLLDARLQDGSRVNAVVRPLALRGTCITIRKFPSKPLQMDDLVKFNTITARMARFLQRTVTIRKNLLISGGTGSGKTTLLNILSGAIPGHERIVTIEDAAELRLMQPHVVSLESRPANMEGKGEITIRDLVRNAMRMRPDRIIVGECRGGESLDMLQAMNTGHSGSMTTTHANNPYEALKRVEILALMAGLDVPSRALREQIAAAIEVVVQQARLSDGTRKVTSIAEVVGMDDDGQVQTRELFGFRQTGTGKNGEVEGEFYATGNLPTYVGDFITRGLVADGEEVV